MSRTNDRQTARLRVLTLTAPGDRRAALREQISAARSDSRITACDSTVEAMRLLLHTPFQLLVVDCDTARSSTPVLLRHTTQYAPGCSVLVFGAIEKALAQSAYTVWPWAQTVDVLNNWLIGHPPAD